jgi:hypothetical protein
MTLMDAQQYDPDRDRRRRNVILAIVIAVLIGSWATYHLRDSHDRAIARRFFSDLQKQDYESAYSVWFRDPRWKEHPTKYPNYSYSDFYRDWGPSGEWGVVKSFHVDCSLSPSGGSGVIVQVTVNKRADHAYLWVQKSDRTLSFSPNDIECGNWWTWLTE